MGKIQRCPEITQARFMNLCCLYWSKEAELTLEDAEIEVDKEHLDILIAKKVIEEDGKYIFIKFLDEQLEDISETSKGKSKAAKARWDKYRKEKAEKDISTDSNAKPMHVHKDAMQNSAEERRGEKRREEERRGDNKEAVASESIYPISKLESSPQEIERKKVPQKKETIFSAEVHDCFDNCLEYFSPALHPDETQKPKWLDTIDKLNRIDGIPFELIEKVAKKVRSDAFWSKNFMSITKLRKNNPDGVKYITFFYEKFKNTTNGSQEQLRNIAAEARAHNPNI
tara:strand:- start:65 stop:916 length:852 start_codon:yes stop_codon:yes gene_type:complete